MTVYITFFGPNDHEQSVADVFSNEEAARECAKDHDDSTVVAWEVEDEYKK